MTITDLSAATGGDGLNDLLKVKARTLDLLACSGEGDRGAEYLARADQRGKAIMARPFEPIAWTDPTEEAFNERLNAYLNPVVQLAVCWASDGGELYHDPRVLERILDSLDSALANFTPETPRKGNWYYWLIQIPDKLGMIGLLIEPALPDDLRGRLETSLAFELQDMLLNGPNAAWEARNHCYLAMLQKDTARLGRAAARIFDTVRYGADDGVCEDYGFLFHGSIPYAGTYGTGFVETVGQFMFLFDGTRWMADPARRDVLANTLLEHYRWVAVHGYLDPIVCGRAYMRAGGARPILEAMLYMTRVEISRQAEMKSAARAMIADGTPVSADVAAMADALEGTQADPPTGFRYWRTCELGVYRGDDYYVGFRQYSSRVQDYEFLTAIGGTGWTLAYGFTYISRNGREIYDGDRHDRPIDHYDWQRLPGTTNRIGVHPVNSVDDIHNPRHSLNFGRSDFAGAAGLDDGGMAGFILVPTHGDFSARKSLTFFPGGFLALGSAIDSTADPDESRPVQTTILQWAAPRADAPLAVSGLGDVELADGRTRTLEQIEWLLFDGVGVAFYDPTEIRVRRDGRLLCIWLDHGNAPKDAGYAYAVLPKATRVRLDAFVRVKPVRPLRCDRQTHVVADTITGSTASVFFTPGKAEGIFSTAEAIVYLRQGPDGATVALQDPRHKRRSFTVNLPVSNDLDFVRVDREITALHDDLTSPHCVLSVESEMGRIYRAGFGAMGESLRAVPREDLSAYHEIPLRLENDPVKTVITLALPDEITAQDYEVSVEGCRGHQMKVFKPSEALAGDSGGVRFVWNRHEGQDERSDQTVSQIEGDFRLIVRTHLKTGTEYFTVPRFDEQGRASYPDDLPVDMNQPPQYRTYLKR